MAAATTAAIITSCKLRTSYSEYRHTPLEGWEKNDTLFYDVQPARQAGRYVQMLGIRIDDSFPYTSLSLIVEQSIIHKRKSGTDSPLSYRTSYYKTDTVRCHFTDSQGRLSGPGINLHQYDFPIGTIDLRPGDSLHIKVRHTMKREIMPGVADVGIRIEQQY